MAKTMEATMEYPFSTVELENAARISKRPEKFLLLMEVPHDARPAIAMETIALVSRYGGKYTCTMQNVVDRYLKHGKKGLHTRAAKELLAEGVMCGR